MLPWPALIPIKSLRNAWENPPKIVLACRVLLLCPSFIRVRRVVSRDCLRFMPAQMYVSDWLTGKVRE